MRSRSKRGGSTTSVSTPIRGERRRFSSAILPAGARKSPQISPADKRGVAAAVSARLVDQRLRAGVGTVPRVGCGFVGNHDHPADRAVARRGPYLRCPGPLGQRPRLPVGRRHPPQGPPGPGKAVPAGDAGGPCRWPQGAGSDHRWVPRIHRVMGRSVARLPPPRHDRPRPGRRQWRVGVLECRPRGVPSDA